MSDRYRALSLWHDSLADDLAPRPQLTTDRDVDVAIVGAGYTGLWTAYYLKKLRPEISVAIVEAEIAGFGASGRNGGWCIGALAGIDTLIADPATRDGAIALMRAMFETVDEVGSVAESEEISCDFAKGGTIQVATSPPHVGTLKRQNESLRSLGFGEEDFAWLEPDECNARIRTAPNLGGMYTPHCAAIHPAKLVRGLAEVVERLGATIYEHSPARSVGGRVVSTDSGDLNAEIVVRATEGYTPRLEGHTRKLIPIHTMMIATEPLPQSLWDAIGLSERETFGDSRRVVIYGQRTADGRLAFGGRGEYYFGSAIKDTFAASDALFTNVHRTLTELFPGLRGVEITHRWGGPIGVPRNWRPSVGLNRRTGFAWAGGYVGEGVAASNLAGRTLAYLILERETELIKLPWVGRPFPRWEPEPLRWAGVRAVRALAESVDSAELNSGQTPKLRSQILNSFIG